MKLIRATTLTLIASALLFSCKKDHDVPEPVIPPAATTYDNYSNLKVGNYWVYQLFNTDSTGSGTPTSDYDSCYVEKDTTIGINSYHKYVQLSPSGTIHRSVYFLRDSLSYTVDSRGFIYCSSTDFTGIFDSHCQVNSPPASDTIYKRSSMMVDETSLPPATVPAGTFSVLNYRVTYIMYAGYTAGGYRRNLNSRYCKDIGLISQTLPFFVSSLSYKERRLIRYHLE